MLSGLSKGKGVVKGSASRRQGIPLGRKVGVLTG